MACPVAHLPGIYRQTDHGCDQRYVYCNDKGIKQRAYAPCFLQRELSVLAHVPEGQRPKK